MPDRHDSSAYDVFLSHGSPDKPWVRELYGHLKTAGLSAYLDEVEIGPGDHFVCNLSKGVGSTGTFVVVLSEGTADRPWVTHEWASFMAVHGPTNRIIPVLLDNVELPAFLSPFQVIFALDRNALTVASRILGAVRAGVATSLAPYAGQTLLVTIAASADHERLTVTAGSRGPLEVTPPWRQGSGFGIALMDFERLTREAASDDATRAVLTKSAQTLGEALFDVLFSDEPLRQTFERATAPGARPVLTVRSGDDVLLSLPWELLYRDGRFLVREGVLDVVRDTITSVQFTTLLTPPSEPFSVVTHIAAPEGSALSYEAESFRLTHALTDHCPQTPTELGTLDDLVKTVGRTRPRGIHFSGHGLPGALVFEDDEGFENRVSIDQVVTELRRYGDGTLPPFFFLASCHGNTPAMPAEGQTGSSSSAAQLHRQGVTEVVGYYGPIGDELSTRAEESLYAAISAGEPTRLAVGRARRALQRPFDGDVVQRPAGGEMRSPSRGAAAAIDAAPFAWAQLVFYRRGPEHPLGTPASAEKLRQREAALKRTYRSASDRTFLDAGFIGRRQEMHQLRRRRKRGDRVFVLQGLGGLGKTTLAGHLLPQLAAPDHTVTIWARRTEGEHDQAEALVGQLLTYARARFGAGFEQVVSHVDREAGDEAALRFGHFLQVILAQQRGTPLVVYVDNLESLLNGPAEASVAVAPDAKAFGAWRTEALQSVWRVLMTLADAVEDLYVVASCRYRNEDLAPGLLAVSPLAEADVFRLMAWFPALRRLSSSARARLAGRLSGHPRAVEFLDALIAASLRTWEKSHGEWIPPSPRDTHAIQQEWERVVEPALPNVRERIWSDLLLATLWERVLDPRAHRMLFRMTLLRQPWDEGLLSHLGDVGDDPQTCGRTAGRLSDTSLLEQATYPFQTREGTIRLLLYSIHAATAAFVKSHFGGIDDLVIESHHRIGAYLETKAATSPDLSVDIEAGYHLFEAGEYDRAFVLVDSASAYLRTWGRTREGLRILLPFLAESVQQRMSRQGVGSLLGAVGLSYAHLGETSRTIEFTEKQLRIAREISDRPAEGDALGNLGIAYLRLGETQRAIEYHEAALEISRELGDRRAEAQDLGNLANAYFRLGEPRRAIEYQNQNLVTARSIGDKELEGKVLGNLGNIYAELGEVPRAISFYEQRLAIAREIRDKRGEAAGLGNLGRAYVRLGDVQRGIQCIEQQLGLARESGDRQGQGGGLVNLGAIYGLLGDTHRAISFFEQALAIGQAISDPRIVNACETSLRELRGSE